MKVFQLSLIALLAGASFYALPTVESQAQTRFHLIIPGFPPAPPRRHYHYYPDPDEEMYGYEDEYDDEVYYYPYDEEDYFEPAPRYQAPPRKKSKPSTAYAAPDDQEPAPAPKTKKKKPTAKSTTATKPKQTTPAASVSCDKAKSIITGYGFGNIETKSCSGKIYSFAAKRDGKSFSVKVSALNGELTEVKRQ
jgi:hypothetical protein